MKYSIAPMSVLLVITIAVFTLMLSSCLSFDTRYKNDEGKEFQCKGSGFGIFGTLMTLDAESKCEKKAIQAGYNKPIVQQ